MDAQEFARLKSCIGVAIDHVIEHGSDDIFKSPVFYKPIEQYVISEKKDEFQKLAFSRTLDFLKQADLRQQRIGPARRCLVVRDRRSYRQVSWLDPFDTIKYLATTLMLFEKIEAKRVPRCENVVHSHRMSDDPTKIFDRDYGYGSFRKAAGKLALESVGSWLVATDISNFFDRIGNHSLENHLLDIGCDRKYVKLVREILLFWSGDRRSFGLPVGSDGSRILSEAVLIDIDRKLIERKFRFVRYVDDFRLVAASQSQAYDQLLFITELLAEEGLALNASKTSISRITDDFESGFDEERIANEHEKIDLAKTVLRTTSRRVSGRTSYSKRFEKPGARALQNLKKLKKDDVIRTFETSPDDLFESNVKLLVKFFVYVEQDVSLLQILLSSRKTTIFYICDALIKEHEKFNTMKCQEIVTSILQAEQWSEAAYPYLMPVLRLFSHNSYRHDDLARSIFDDHRLEDNLMFFREFLMVSYSSIDRMRMRKLAIEIFGKVPDFVQRVIYSAVESHPSLSADEKRPLLKNMKQSTDDWFIENRSENGGIASPQA